MGFLLEGGPRDGEYSEDLPEGYAAKGIYAGIVSEANPSPTPKAVWTAPSRQRPKDAYTEQLIEEEYESYGEGARRELFED